MSLFSLTKTLISLIVFEQLLIVAYAAPKPEITVGNGDNGKLYSLMYYILLIFLKTNFLALKLNNSHSN